jgi:hypothetical protein
MSEFSPVSSQTPLPCGTLFAMCRSGGSTMSKASLSLRFGLTTVCIACSLIAGLPRAERCPANEALAVEPLPVPFIQPGTHVDQNALSEGLHVVFRCKPKIVSGDVAKLRRPIQSAVESFTTIVLLETERDSTERGKFRCGPASIGVGMPHEPGDIVLTKAAANECGIGLGIVERSVLSAREKELGTVRSPGSSATMAMFDFQTVFCRNDEHINVLFRYAALVNPQDGAVETVYWILEPTEAGYQLLGDSLRLLPTNETMDWEMHVDGSTIKLGTPSWDTFAVTTLPKGTEYVVPDDLKVLSAQRTFAPAAASRLEQALRELVARN